MRNLLLLSSSKEGDSGYLTHALGYIEHFLSNTTQSRPTKALFIPFAGVTISYDEYETMVKEAIKPVGVELESIHHSNDPQQSIKNAEAIIVGGGNTFHLLHQLFQFDLIGSIREKVMKGTPYIGWSAGSNIAAPTIKTTNDMPIIQPPSFHALHLVPFQINPHFLDKHPPGFNGETRAQRLKEFMVVNPDSNIIGLPEGTAVQLINDEMTLLGDKETYLFARGQQSTIQQGESLQKLLEE